ncbi:MAG TPA: alanine--glyoxylate aminotransferase family protein [Firmicutes bacterium]|nr:alanine--glyoxylate aminotransferase family protein [Bacillota bacterium]
MIKGCDLMIPGPIPVENDVLLEMASPVVAHYGGEWARVYEETVELAKKIFRTKNQLFIWVGSGHAGIDAAMGSLLEPGDEILVPASGHFGIRLGEIAGSWGANVRSLSVAPGEVIQPEAVERELAAHPGIKVVGLVHHETATGLANPLKEIAQVVKRAGALLVVDAVSSLGGLELDVDGWGIDICVSASQKCLEAPPGLVLVSVSDAAWEAMKGRTSAIPGWYLNLLRWKEFADRFPDHQPYFITMAVNNVLALRRSMQLVLNEGLEARVARHRAVGLAFRRGLQAMGLAPVGDEHYASGIVSVFYVPEGHSSREIVEFLKEEFGIQVASGLRELAETTVRVGHMGPGARMTRIMPVLFGIEEWLRRKSHRAIAAGASMAGIARE